MWEAVTFTAFLVNQAISSRTQALIANFKVFADMRAASVVVQALIGACNGKEKSFFFEDIISIPELHTH